MMGCAAQVPRTPRPAPKVGSATGGMGEVAGRIGHGSCDLMILNLRVMMQNTI